MFNYYLRRFKYILIFGGLIAVISSISSLVGQISENHDFKKQGKIALVDTINNITRAGSYFNLKFKTADGRDVVGTLLASPELEMRIKNTYDLEIIYLAESPTQIRAAGEQHPIGGYFWALLLESILLILAFLIPTDNTKASHV